jgi:hypothetical protein
MASFGVAFLLGAGAVMATACCSVSPPGKPVAFGDQTNIVVWNELDHTEHFIRDAKFRSDAPDFGFIAPTPTKPELSEASSEAFVTLVALRPAETSMSCSKSDDAAGSSKALNIVQQVDVAGYRATTLLASDSAELAAWMRTNGYQTSPAVEAWTKFYIAKGWYLTAFKVIDKAQVASTGTVRMSFKADRPFNPYFVPSDNIKEGQKGTLKLYFVASGAYGAKVGKSEAWQDALWEAPVPGDTARKLAEELKLPFTAIPPDASVSAFVDSDFPRSATDDLYFTKRRPNWGLDLVGFGLLGGVGVLAWRRWFGAKRLS